MSGQFANTTTVSVEKTRAEIESTLGKYGACRFAYMAEPGRAVVGFGIQDPLSKANLMIRMTLPLPTMDEFKRRKVRGWDRICTPEKQMELWEQACRSSWRALLLVIKAKLEACACGISTVEREFLADVMTGDGRTIGEILRPQIDDITKGATVKLLSA